MALTPDLAKLVAQELARLTAVSDPDQIGSPPEERFDRITRLARSVFRVPVAEINILDDFRQYTKSPYVPGHPVYTDRTETFCDVTIQGDGILVVPDAEKDPRFSTRGLVTGARRIRFYAGRPLVTADGHRVGTLCVVDTKPRTFSVVEHALLDQLGQLVERELGLDSDPDHLTKE